MSDINISTTWRGGADVIKSACRLLCVPLITQFLSESGYRSCSCWRHHKQAGDFSPSAKLPRGTFELFGSTCLQKNDEVVYGNQSSFNLNHSHAKTPEMWSGRLQSIV